MFKRQAKVAEWLVLSGANLHILTEGGISPLEKAFEIDEAMSALLVHRAAYVEENGPMTLNQEQNEAQYKDVATKWGEQTIYVETDPEKASGAGESDAKSEAPAVESIAQSQGFSTRAEPVDCSLRATLSPAELQQQQELLMVQELAASSSMQDSLIQRQLQEMESSGNSTGVVPALRRLTETPQVTTPPLTKAPSEEEKMRGSIEGMVRSEIGSSVYDMLELAAKQNEKALPTGPTAHKDNFSKGLDAMTSSMAQFVQVLVDGISRGPLHVRNFAFYLHILPLLVSFLSSSSCSSPSVSLALSPSLSVSQFSLSTSSYKCPSSILNLHCWPSPRFPRESNPDDKYSNRASPPEKTRTKTFALR